MSTNLCTSIQHLTIAQESNPQTGSVQFNNNFPGVFIRGDVALFGIRPALEEVIRKPHLAHLFVPQLKELLKIINSCHVSDVDAWRKGQ